MFYAIIFLLVITAPLWIEMVIGLLVIAIFIFGFVVSIVGKLALEILEWFIELFDDIHSEHPQFFLTSGFLMLLTAIAMMAKYYKG